MREMFGNRLDASELAIRTLRVYDLVAEEIILLKPDMSFEEATEKAKSVLQKVGVKPKKGSEDKVEALFFIGRQQAKNLAVCALSDGDDKGMENEAYKAIKENIAIEIALFGRMVASNPLLNSDATAQVAHAISTHPVENEFDYFTAVDDLSPEDNAGAGMIGTIEYNSSTLYRYATIATHNLFEELNENEIILENALREFLRAFVLSMPTGKQNTFAANTVPDSVLVAIRTDRPLNLVGAFETPINGTAFIPASAVALEKYAQSVYEDFCPRPQKSYVVGEFLGGLGERVSLEQLLDMLGKDVLELIKP